MDIVVLMVVLFEDIKDFLTARGGPRRYRGRGRGTDPVDGAEAAKDDRGGGGRLHGAGHRAGGRVVCRGVHKAYFLRLLIREIRAALGTWNWKGKGNVLESRAAGGRQPAG